MLKQKVNSPEVFHDRNIEEVIDTYLAHLQVSKCSTIADLPRQVPFEMPSSNMETHVTSYFTCAFLSLLCLFVSNTRIRRMHTK